MTFNAKDENTWSPALRITVTALDELTIPDEISYLFGYVAGAVEGIAREAGVDVDMSAVLDISAALIAEAWVGHDPGLDMEDAIETASDGGEL